jgi:hypothetical protein
MKIEISENLFFRIRKKIGYENKEVFGKFFFKILIYDESEYLKSDNTDGFQFNINKNSLSLKSYIKNFINDIKNDVELIIVLNDDLSELSSYQSYLESINKNF